jgi:hypothetical protein
MADVRVSGNVTDPHCGESVTQLRRAWQTELTRRGSKGHFQIIHGADKPCTIVHDEPFNGGFWIVPVLHRCKVFLTKGGRPSFYVGAGRHSDSGAYRGTGHCTCGGGH